MVTLPAAGHAAPPSRWPPAGPPHWSARTAASASLQPNKPQITPCVSVPTQAFYYYNQEVSSAKTHGVWECMPDVYNGALFTKTFSDQKQCLSHQDSEETIT